MSYHYLLNWWNLIYTLPLAVSVLWILISVVGGMQESSGDDLGDGADSDADLGDGHGMSRFLAFVGAGDVSISMLVGLLMLTWGSIGMLINRVMGILDHPSALILPSILITLVASFTVTRAVAEIVGRITPRDETFGVERRQLVGLLGHTVYQATEKSGTINVRDQYGTVHRVQAKVQEGESVIAPGTDVVVIDYDEDEKRFVVRKSDLL